MFYIYAIHSQKKRVYKTEEEEGKKTKKQSDRTTRRPTHRKTHRSQRIAWPDQRKKNGNVNAQMAHIFMIYILKHRIYSVVLYVVHRPHSTAHIQLNNRLSAQIAHKNNTINEASNNLRPNIFVPLSAAN